MAPYMTAYMIKFAMLFFGNAYDGAGVYALMDVEGDGGDFKRGMFSFSRPYKRRVKVRVKRKSFCRCRCRFQRLRDRPGDCCNALFPYCRTAITQDFLLFLYFFS